MFLKTIYELFKEFKLVESTKLIFHFP